jgi:hypothetical protein
MTESTLTSSSSSSSSLLSTSSSSSTLSSSSSSSSTSSTLSSFIASGSPGRVESIVWKDVPLPEGLSRQKQVTVLYCFAHTMGAYKAELCLRFSATDSIKNEQACWAIVEEFLVHALIADVKAKMSSSCTNEDLPIYAGALAALSRILTYANSFRKPKK